jgi:hypothetical protein
MMVENLVEWRWAGETEVLGENPPQRHFVHHKSHLTRPWNFIPVSTAFVQIRQKHYFQCVQFFLRSGCQMCKWKWSLSVSIWHPSMWFECAYSITYLHWGWEISITYKHCVLWDRALWNSTIFFRHICVCREGVVQRVKMEESPHAKRPWETSASNVSHGRFACRLSYNFPSTLKMEAIRSSETSVNTISTRCHIP